MAILGEINLGLELWLDKFPFWALNGNLAGRNLGMYRIGNFKIWPEPDSAGFLNYYLAGTGTGSLIGPISSLISHVKID